MSNSTTAKNLYDTYTYVDSKIALVVAVIVSVIAILGNALTLLVMWMYSYLRVKQNILLASLAICDLIVGIVGTILLLLRDSVLKGCVNTFWIVLGPSLKDILVITSAFHLVVLAFDRLIAITKPLRYEELVTAKRLVIVCIGTWIFSLCLTATNFFWLLRTVPCKVVQVPNEFRLALKGSIYLAVLLIICMIYCHIFLIARRAARVHPHVSNASSGAPQPPAPTSNKALRVVVPIIVVYLITWGAYFAYYLGSLTLPRSITKSYAWNVFEKMATPFIYINSGANMFVYILRSSHFRRAFKSLFFVCRNKIGEAGESSATAVISPSRVQ